MDTLKCFISCRFDTEDLPVVDFLTQLLDSLSFSTYVARDADIRPPEEKIREEISLSDCICVIATRGTKIDGENKWFTSEWIYSEIGIAAALDKPVICFLEKGVIIRGLGEKKTSFFEFEKESLKENVFDVVRFVNKTRRQIETMKALSPSMNYPYRLKNLFVHLSLKDDLTWLIEREMEIVCLRDYISEISGETWISNGIEFPFISPVFDAFNLNAAENRDIRIHDISKQKSYIRWRLGVDPDLNKDEELLLGWSLSTQGYIPKWIDELKNVDHGAEAIYGRFVAQEGITINNPTEKLVFEISFPSGYDVSNAEMSVVRGSDPSIQIVPEEVRRVRESGGFRFKEKGIRRSIRLEVINPMTLHTYQVFWVPATKKQS